ncbi:hypothetical protein SLEP1_g29052 [Rubroshorea leprosula]|uniref:Retrotransposon gag domain-containing protein n=1 Tax=Rubroshorea leprosula TaxID=152421 RepID=A0AAV5K1D3_9ROSI|nr:hypothetical protein SLEP1_g29052 [Rubroshorea leprosula]
MAALIESQDMQGFLGDEYNMPAMTIKVPDGTDAMGSKEFEEVLGIVIGLTTAHNVWNALEEAYAQDSQEREFNLNQAVTLQRKGDDSLGEYLRKLKYIRDELATMGKIVPDKTKFFLLLQSLGHGYENFFSDVDWAGCPLTCRSTFGYCTFFGSTCISWCAKKQPIVAHSSAEAEYRSMASTAAEIT